jgi:hypothetical protein
MYDFTIKEWPQRHKGAEKRVEGLEDLLEWERIKER